MSPGGQTFEISATLNWPNVADLTLRGGYEGEGAPGDNDPERWRTRVLRASGAGVRLLNVDGRSGAVIEGLILDGRGVRAQVSGYGIYVNNSTDTLISRCQIVDHHRSRNGYGAVWLNNSDGVVEKCLIAYNSTEGYSSNTDSGGGLALVGGAWTVLDTVLAGNGAGLYDGAYAGAHGMPRSGTSRGGGAFLDGDHDFINVLVANNGMFRNATMQGGGIHVAGGNVTLENVTVAGNYNSGLHRQGGNVTVRNSIFWRNHGTDLNTTDGLTLENNLISDGTSDGIGNNFADDPLFEFPMFYLQPDSPATNRGNRTATAAGVAGLTSFTNGITYADPGGEMVNLGFHYPEGVVWDTNLWVDANVAVSGDGSESDPFKSIREALEAGAPRTRIHVADGTYTHANESFPLDVPSGRTVQFLGESRDGTILDAGNVDGRRVLLFMGSMGDNRIERLTITRGRSPDSRIGGGLFVRSSALRLEDMRLSGNTSYRLGSGSGMAAEHSSLLMDNCRVDANEFEGRSGDHVGAGLFLVGGSAVLRNSVVADNLKDGATGNTRGLGVAIRTTDAELFNVLIKGQSAAGTTSGGGMYVSSPGTRVIIENCNFVGNDVSGIHSTADTSPRVYNTIFWDNPLDYEGAMAAADFMHCFSTQLPSTDQGNINAGDPLFVDAPARNYRLKTEYGRYVEGTGWVFDGETSPAIDAGTNRAWMATATDLDGRDRLARGIPSNLEITVDMGAYEMHPMPRGTLIFMR